MVLWCDIESGDDTTGAGTYANPYKTINKCLSLAASLEETRCKATSAHTTHSENVTWTINSTAVVTTSDLSGSISAGDYIGKPTVAGNGAEEGFFRVASISGVNITLDTPYYGPDGTEITTSMIQATIANTGESDHIIDSDTGSSDCIVSGGWDSETTQNGETHVKHNGTKGQYTFCYGLTDQVEFVNHMNFYECNYWHISVGTPEFTNCSGFTTSSENNNTFLYNCRWNSDTTSTHWANQTGHLTDCIYHGAGGGYMVYSSAASLRNIFTGTKFYGLTGIATTLAYGDVSMEFHDCELHYANYVYSSGFTGCISTKNCTFTNISVGAVYGGIQQSLINFENCTFEDCIYAFRQYRFSGKAYFSNCDFTRCGYVISGGDSYGGDNTIFSNCTFTDTTNYVASLYAYYQGTVSFIDCTISAGDESKLINNTDGNIFGQDPRYMVLNTDTAGIYPEGSYYGRFSLTKDPATYRTAAPSLRLLNKSTTLSYVANTPFKLHSMYVKDGTGKRVTFYHQEGTGWSGEIKFHAYLNGALVKSYPSETINSINADWTEITLDILDVEVTDAGELAIYADYYGNTVQVNFDDFSQVDL